MADPPLQPWQRDRIAGASPSSPERLSTLWAGEATTPQATCHSIVSQSRAAGPATLRSISTTSVAIELDQPLVTDPEVMRDLVEHDMSDLAA